MRGWVAFPPSQWDGSRMAVGCQSPPPMGWVKNNLAGAAAEIIGGGGSFLYVFLCFFFGFWCPPAAPPCGNHWFSLFFQWFLVPPRRPPLWKRPRPKEKQGKPTGKEGKPSKTKGKPTENQRKPRFLTHPIGGRDWAADAYGDPSHWEGGGTGDQQPDIIYIIFFVGVGGPLPPASL